MKIRIQHRTTYRYNETVALGQHRLLLRPREGHDVHIESSLFDIFPVPTVHWMRDVYGNCIAKADFTGVTDRLSIYSEVVLQHYDENPRDFIVSDYALHYPFVYDPNSQPELAAFVHILYPKSLHALRAWVAQFWQSGQAAETVELLQRITRFIHDTFQYCRRDEWGVQTPLETLQRNQGSCRDFATLFIEACHCLGLAARFVSGYMLSETTVPGGSSTHAWAEVYIPGVGWKGFDPICGGIIGSDHVAVAVSRDPERCAPISGTFFGNGGAFRNISVDVQIARENVFFDSIPVPPLAEAIPATQFAY